ncbi:MAG: ABC transporter permease, partial [Micromonosporaceae bacterium]|nr:ABC transporter permease [Micromonosporaceae bacterium]
MNRTICWITARGLIGRRRFLLLLPLPLLLVGLAALAESLGGSDPAGANTVMVGFGMAVVVPLTALIVGTGVLSPEIDDGTLLHVLAKPLSRAEILGSKLAIAGIVSLVTTVPALLASGLILDGVATGLGFAAGGAVTVVAYCAV